MGMKMAALIVICLVFFALMLLVSCKSKQEVSLFPIEVDGQMGYIDKTEKVVINSAPPAGAGASHAITTVGAIQ